LEKIDPNTSRAIQKQLRDAAKPQTQQRPQGIGDNMGPTIPALPTAA